MADCIVVVDRRGIASLFFHWILSDNYEWAKAYSVKFGLIAVGRSEQKRMPKPSLAYLGSICKEESER